MILYPPIYQTSLGTPRDLGSLMGFLSQRFGENIEFYQKNLKTNGHTGLDWPCITGTPVYAPCEATVLSISTDPARGMGVLLDNGEANILLWHFSAVDAQVGQKVYHGTRVGLSGNSGFSTSPHLHMEVKPLPIDQSNGFYGAVDPTPYMAWKPLPSKTMLDKEDVKFLQALEGFSDQAGIDFWGDGTHTLKEYKAARVPDKIQELTKL